MNLNEIYRIQSAIAQTVYPGVHDWEDRLEVRVKSSDNISYLQFKAHHTIINILANNQIVICGLVRKALKFQHQDLATTIAKIQAELQAHLLEQI
jgi:hypothetical protein